MAKTGTGYVALAGSNREVPKWTRTETLIGDEVAEVTVRLRGRKALSPRSKPEKRLSRTAYETGYGSTERDIAAVEQFADDQAGLNGFTNTDVVRDHEPHGWGGHSQSEPAF